MSAVRVVPPMSARGGRCVAATADGLATQAAMWTFARGGNAVDAALGANAALAVVAPHLCGMGGDLFALVRTPDGAVVGLNASGRAGSGADSDAVRADGHRTMPLRHDIRTVTVPGCVDGWMALHERFGSLPFGEIVAPATRLAASGFPASPLLAGALGMLDPAGRASLTELREQATVAGAVVRRPGVALTLQSLVRGGRDAFYGGAFGEGLVDLGAGLFTEDDLARGQADWVPVLQATVFGHELTTIGPNSQGYLALAIADVAEQVGLPDDVDDSAWVHVLLEAAKAASYDRPDVLHDAADGESLLSAARSRAEMIDVASASRHRSPGASGDTTYLCTADDRGYAVSLIQSNASGFGSWIVEPTTGINLHNRGLGFSLEPAHPAEFAPGRRPPHTLLPAMATRDGNLAAVLGTMGGDAQPQIVAQVAARLLRHGASPAEAVVAPRAVLRGPVTGFDTWTADGPPTVLLEAGIPDSWVQGLADRGHHVEIGPALSGAFGHAHCIVVDASGTFTAAADPRSLVGTSAAL